MLKKIRFKVYLTKVTQYCNYLDKIIIHDHKN